MKTTIAAIAAGLLLVSAPAFAGGNASHLNSGAHATPESTQGANASGVNANDPNATRTARNAASPDNSWNQNQSAGEATPAAPDAGANAQPGSNGSVDATTNTPAPAQ